MKQEHTYLERYIYPKIVQNWGQNYEIWRFIHCQDKIKTRITLGPKQIIPELVRNPNLDVDLVMLDHDPMYYNCPDMSGLSFHDNDY